MLLSMDNGLINDLLDRDKMESYIYGIVKTMWTMPKDKFYYTYRIESLELKEHILPDKRLEPFNVKQYLIDLGLDPTEKLWIETCLEYNFNYSLVAKKTGISRSHISKRIKAITNKYK